MDSAVLSVLSRSKKAFTGRELAKQAGRSPSAVQAVLDRLVINGLVTKQLAGASALYRLNRGHLAADAIQDLSRLRNLLVTRLRDALAAWMIQPVHASMFGSAARGDGDVHSDIDILIVRPHGFEETDLPWADQIDSLGGAVRSWSGNSAAIIEIPQSDLQVLRDERAAILDEIERDGVRLAGSSVDELVAVTRGA